jgi:predicted esterase
VRLALPCLLAAGLTAASLTAPASGAPAPAAPTSAATVKTTPTAAGLRGGRDDPELGELVAGEGSYVSGKHVWTDYAYDDRGPDTDPFPGGDAAYPPAPHPGNTADLIQLQVGADRRGGLFVRAVLQTLVPGRDALVGVGFDTDRRADTGAPTLPGDQWANRDPLGLERLVVLGTDGHGALWAWHSGAWHRSGELAVGVDRGRNLLRATVRGLRPGHATWDAVGVAGRAEDGGSWLTGALPIQDLAYLRGEDPTNQVLLSVPGSLPPPQLQPMQDHLQASTLAGATPSHRAVVPVRFGTHRDRAPQVREGYNAFLYHSRVPVPEGVASDPRVFNGIYQPYAVWVPADLPARPPMVMFLHGADQYQNVNVAYFSNPESLGIPSPYDVPAVVIFPNGRTPNWGTPVADRDALDAMDDAVHRLRVDEDRVVVSGVSSGGYGTYHLASRYPDRFTGAYSLVGGTALGGGPAAAVENLTNIPFRASNGLADPLVNAQTWRTSADALAAAGTVDYRIVLVHNRSHDGPLAEGNCYLLDLLSRDRVRDPARVRFRVPAYVPQVLSLGLQPRGAYWVSGLRPRTVSSSGAIDVESLARRGRVIAQDQIRQVGENATHPADFCGPHPTMQNGNNWNIEGRSWQPGPERSANRLSVDLENLRSAKLDLARAGIDTRRAVRLTVTSDGPTTLRLLGYGVLRVPEGRSVHLVRP